MFLMLIIALFVIGLAAWYFSRKEAEPDGVKRTVLITGAAAGLGREAALHCVRAGDTVVAVDMNQKALEALQAEGGKSSVHIFQADVSNENSLTDAAQQVRQALGENSLDTIACFAGLIRGGPLVEMESKDMALVMNVNTMGTFYTVKCFFDLLRRSRKTQNGTAVSPKVVTVASEVSYAWFSGGFNAPYSMSKFAVEAYSSSLRHELSWLDDPVSVVVLNPGAMKTPMVANQKAGGTNAYMEAAAEKPGTLWKKSLLKGSQVAQEYMLRNASDPTAVGKLLHKVMHNPSPRRRYVVGASFEMQYVIPYLPHWLMDTLIAKEMSS